jgi:hypothetical protein
MKTEAAAVGQVLDLTHCDKEPIQDVAAGLIAAPLSRGRSSREGQRR